jgi:predicted N-acetyltransferase YhbS
MSPPFSVRLATEADNEQLLALTRLCPNEGSIAFCTERDPRFFALTELQGDPTYVAVAEDGQGRVVGCASLALRRVYVDGNETPCLYAGDLKVAPDARGSTIVHRLHDLLAEAVHDLPVDLGYTSIVVGNSAANALVGSRRGMPLYRPLGRIRVCALLGSSLRTGRASDGVSTATDGDVPEIVALLNRFNAGHNFAPLWTEATFARAVEAPGLSLDRFRLAREGGRLVGVLAAWNQSAFQRTRLLAYPRSLAAYRSLHNLSARVRRAPSLPPPGGILEQLYVTHIAIDESRPSVLDRLLASVLRESRGRFVLTFGLAEGHALIEGLRGFRVRWFPTVVHALTRPASRWVDHDFSARPLFHEISHL